MYNLYDPHGNFSLEDTNKYLSLKSIFRDEKFPLHDFDFIIKNKDNDEKITFLPDNNDYITNLGNSLIIKKYNKDMYLRLYLTNFEEYLYSVEIKLPYYHSKGYEESFENIKWNYIKTKYNLLLDHQRYIDISLSIPRDYIVSLVADCFFHYMEKEFYFDITSANIKQTTFEGMINDVNTAPYHIKYPSRIDITNTHIWLNDTSKPSYVFKADKFKLTEFLIDCSGVSPVFKVVSDHEVNYTGEVVFENLIFTNCNPDSKFVLFDLIGCNNVTFRNCYFYDFHYNIVLTAHNSVVFDSCSFINCEMYDYNLSDRQIIINDYPNDKSSITTPSFYLHNFTEKTNTDGEWVKLHDDIDLYGSQYRWIDVYNFTQDVRNVGVLTLKETFNDDLKPFMDDFYTFNNSADHSLLVIKNIFLNNNRDFFHDFNYCTLAYLSFYVKFNSDVDINDKNLDNDLYVIFDSFYNVNDVINYENDYYEFKGFKDLVSPNIEEFKTTCKNYLKLNPDDYHEFKKVTLKVPFFNDFNIDNNFYIGFKIPYGYCFNRLTFKLDLEKRGQV